MEIKLSLTDKLILWLLKKIVSITIVETLVPKQATVQLTLSNGKKFTLWTNKPIEQKERYVSVMQPIGSTFPNWDAKTWPKEKTHILVDATVNSVSPY